MQCVKDKKNQSMNTSIGIVIILSPVVVNRLEVADLKPRSHTRPREQLVWQLNISYCMTASMHAWQRYSRASVIVGLKPYTGRHPPT